MYSHTHTYIQVCCVAAVSTAHEDDTFEVHICPHTTYYYICVLILLYMCPHTHTTLRVSAFYFIYVLTQGRDVIQAVRLPPLSRPEATAGTQFTCFTGTKVRILTPEALQCCMLLSKSTGRTS
jgi:hypothetical protein